MCGRKIVDAEFRPQISGQGNFIRFERNTGGVGNTDNRVENGDHCGAIHQGRATEAGLYLVACLGQMGSVEVTVYLRDCAMWKHLTCDSVRLNQASAL